VTPAAGRRRDGLAAVLLAAASGAVFLLSPNRQVTDSHFTLLLSENLLRHGSFALDRYFVPPLDPARHPRLRSNGLPSQIREAADGHLYYFFPPGSSVLSAPFVALMNRIGWSAVGADRRYDMDGERRMQALLSALLMGGVTAVFFFIARAFLAPLPGAAVALAAAFGTQLWSTASRGLWSVTWQLPLIAVVLWRLAAHERRGAPLRPALLATLLAWAYFVRPTSAIFALAVGLYLFRRARPLLARFALWGAAWLAGFAAYSLLHFGAPLPAYYEGGRLSLEGFGVHLLGNLIAPSRGLLVFSPVVLLIGWGLAARRRQLPAPALLAPALFAIGAHLVVASAFPDWAGGHSYGPRMTADLVPWLFLTGVIALVPALQPARPWPLALAAALCGWGVFVHARGALAQETWDWNLGTEIDENVSRRVWDWRYPQFLAGLIEPPRPDRAALAYVRYAPGTRVLARDPASSDYLVDGWSPPGEGARWSAAREAAVAFSLAAPQPLVLRLRVAPYLAGGRIERQRLVLLLNGSRLAEHALGDPVPAELSIAVPAGALAERNLLVLQFPDARAPASLGQGRKRQPRALSLEWLQLDPARGSPPASP
jgi:hypothetical protein